MPSKRFTWSLRLVPVATLPVVMALVAPTVALAARNGLRAPYAVDGARSTPSLAPAGKLTVFAGNGSFALPRPGPATKSPLAGPTGVALDGHGDLFIADHANNMVEEVTPAGKLSVIAGTGKPGRPTPGPAIKSALNAPSGVALDLHGDLYIADSNNNVVEEVTPAGRLSVVVGNGHVGPPTPGPASKSGLDDPSGVALDTHGNLFVADYNNNVVVKVSPAGKLTVVAGNGHGGPPTPGPATKSNLNNPSGVALDARGDLFIADSNNNVVEEVTPAGKSRLSPAMARWDRRCLVLPRSQGFRDRLG